MNIFRCGTPAHDSLESRGFGSNCDKQKPTTRIKKHKPITIDIENLRKQFKLKSKGEKKSKGNEK